MIQKQAIDWLLKWIFAVIPWLDTNEGAQPLREDGGKTAVQLERKRRRKNKAQLVKKRKHRMARRKAAKKQISHITISPHRARFHRSKKVNNT